jgi:hypothetical protein
MQVMFLRGAGEADQVLPVFKHFVSNHNKID